MLPRVDACLFSGCEVSIDEATLATDTHAGPPGERLAVVFPVLRAQQPPHSPTFLPFVKS
jgi:hypothetical protein